MAGLDDVAQQLYAGFPADFIAGRDAAVKAARADGDRELGKQIAALRKPTVSAWLVNTMIRDDPDLGERLTELGGNLREAEQSLDGDAMRTLSQQRRQLVRSLVAHGRTLAADLGQPVTEAVAQEVDATFTAALADPAIAEEVTSGRLTAAKTYSGFGSAGLGSAGLGSNGLGSAGPSSGDGDRHLSLVRPPGGKRESPAPSRLKAPAPSGAKPAAPSKPRGGAAAEERRERELVESQKREAARLERARREEAERQEERRLRAEAQQVWQSAHDAAEEATSAHEAALDRRDELSDQLASAEEALKAAERELKATRAVLKTARARRDLLGRGSDG